MNNKKRTLLPKILILIITAQLCSCAKTPAPENGTSVTSGTVPGTPADSDTSETAPAPEKDIPPMDTSPVTFTLFINDPESAVNFDNAIAEEITARTGVTLEITVADSGDALDKLLEEGELPDLIYAGDRTDELITDGVLLPLDGYMEDLGYNLSALYRDRTGALRAGDGKLYTFGTGGASPAHFTADGTFQVRYEVLEALGYPEIKTLEQLGDALRQYKELDPKTTGLLLCGAPKNQWHDTVSARLNYVYGYPDDGDFFVDSETGEAVYKWTDPRAREYFRWLNGLYNDGLLDEKSFSLKHDDYIKRLTEGTPAAGADDLADYYEAQEAFAAGGNEGKAYLPLAVTADKDTELLFLADKGYAPEAGIAITSACKEPERAFRFLDWWCGDEAQMLVNFGTEGTFDPESEERYYSEPFPMRGLTEKDRNGKFYSRAAEEYVQSYTEAQKAAAEAYGFTLPADMFPQENTLPKIKRTLVSEMDIPAFSEAGILTETLGTYIKTEVPNAVTASPEEFDEKWDEIVEWCEKNGSRDLEELITWEVQTDMGM